MREIQVRHGEGTSNYAGPKLDLLINAQGQLTIYDWEYNGVTGNTCFAPGKWDYVVEIKLLVSAEAADAAQQ